MALLNNWLQLWSDRVRARKLLKRFNHELEYDDMEGRQALLRELLGGFDADAPPFLEPPLYLDYGAPLLHGGLGAGCL